MTVTVEYVLKGEKETVELDGSDVGYKVEPDQTRVYKNDGAKKITHVFVGIPCHIVQVQ